MNEQGPKLPISSNDSEILSLDDLSEKELDQLGYGLDEDSAVSEIERLSQILEERRAELARLEVTLNADREYITNLREEIADLEFKIKSGKK